MATSLQIRESAIAAESRVETLLNAVQDHLHALNMRLVELHDAIKASQPVASGAVCLELYGCGKNCSGCPHARWVLYVWRAATAGKPAQLVGLNLKAKGRDPILALGRKAPHVTKVADQIREAKTVLATRAALLTWLKRAHHLKGRAA